MKFIETKDIKTIYNDMLKQFPKEELKSCEHLENLLGKNYKAYLVIDNEPVGYLLLFESEDFIRVDYVAVYKDFQSKGYGGKILECLKQSFETKKGCFLEVEKPNPDVLNTLRRIKFYESHGAKKLDIDYVYPNKYGGLPMDLYYVSYDGENVSQAEVEKFIGLLFRIVHSDVAVRDW